MVLIIQACDMGVEVYDPFEREGIFEVTIKEYRHEIRIVGGRPIIRNIVSETIFTGEEAFLSYSSGQMVIDIKSKDVNMKVMGEVDGNRLLGLYDVVSYEEGIPIPKDKFAIRSERQTAMDGGELSDSEVVTYESEKGWLQVYMYNPGKRLRAGFNYRARVITSTNDMKQLVSEPPDSVVMVGSFNAIIEGR